MKILIIEDERLLANQLEALILQLKPQYSVAGITNSIQSSVKWLQVNPPPALILMDIELADGQCFEIFKEVDISSPVIFITAFQEHALRAFKVNSVDFLLKPLVSEELAAALDKFERLNVGPDRAKNELYISLIDELRKTNQKSEYRKRFLVKKGQQLMSLDVQEILFFHLRNGLTYAVQHSKREYILDYSLDEVEAMTDPQIYFRANRQFLLSHKIIAEAHPWFNGKLKLALHGFADAEVVISRDRAAAFRSWLGS